MQLCCMWDRDVILALAKYGRAKPSGSHAR